jgi:hypothetical protein
MVSPFAVFRRMLHFHNEGLARGAHQVNQSIFAQLLDQIQCPAHKRLGFRTGLSDALGEYQYVRHWPRLAKTLLPFLAKSAAVKKFIFGLPINCATKALVGLR